MKSKDLFSIKTIVATGVGAAIFFILMRFVAIPTGIPNTSIQTSYAFLGLLAALFGPVAGCLAGLIGHALNDLTSGWGLWWSWIIATGVVGLVIGLAANRLKINEGEFSKKDIITFNIFQVIANAAAWFLVAPTLDILIYAEPADKVYLQGLVAGAANIVTVAVIGTLLILAYSKTIPKRGSLKKDE